MARTLDLTTDFLDMIDCLIGEKARFVVIGGYAMAVHGYIRATGDMDIFIRASNENARKVWRALKSFGAPLGDVSAKDFSKPGITFQMGVPPFRIDILTKIDGVPFNAAIHDAVHVNVNGRTIPFMSLQHLIENKKAAGRDKDKSDARELEKLYHEKNNKSR